MPATATATAQQPPAQQKPPPQSQAPADAALIAAIIAAFLAFHTAGQITAALRAPFRRAGISTAALQAGVALVLSMPQQPLEGHGPAQRFAVRTNELRRAAFALVSVRRIQAVAEQAKAQGEPVIPAIQDAIMAERRFFGQHVAASQGRIDASGVVDSAADYFGDPATQAAARRGMENPPPPGVVLLGWKTFIDKATTPGCLAADGKSFDAAKPVRIEGGYHVIGAVHPKCFPGGTVVTSPGVLAGTARWYTGELVELTTSRGDHLAVTPNHPVLTPQGWVAAGLLDEGCDVIRTSFGERLARLVDPDDYQVPSLIEDVLAALGESGGVMPRAVPVSAEDFHGDGAGSEVAVVWADGVLWDALNAAFTEPVIVGLLQGTARRLPVAGGRIGAALFEGSMRAPGGDMGSLSIARVLLRGALGHHGPVGLGVPAPLYAVPPEDALDPFPADPVLLGERVLAAAGGVGSADFGLGQSALVSAGFVGADKRTPDGSAPQRASLYEALPQNPPRNVHLQSDGIEAAVARLVEADRLVKVVKRPEWSGHVYSLETKGGWHVTGNVVTHNCRCRPMAPKPGAQLLPQ